MCALETSYKLQCLKERRYGGSLYLGYVKKGETEIITQEETAEN
jgi:hypothetical protein